VSARLWLALLTLYLVWGSTYLAIKLTVETIPPILGAGARFVVAGLLLGGGIAVASGFRRFRMPRRDLVSAIGSDRGRLLRRLRA
jgi:drug/metabolite transporter (DMT)-like permease